MIREITKRIAVTIKNTLIFLVLFSSILKSDKWNSKIIKGSFKEGN